MTRERIEKRLELYYEAEEAILSGAQSYTVGKRQLTRADLSEIEATITNLENAIAVLDNKRRLVKRVMFV